MKYEFYTVGTIISDFTNHLIAFGVGFKLNAVQNIEWVYDLDTHTITLHESIAGSVFHQELREYIASILFDLYEGKYEYTEERRDQLLELLTDLEMKKRDYGIMH